jgi:hypothetical protein
MTNVAMNPSANRSDVVITGRPRQSVAIQANTWTVLNRAIVMLAALNRLIDICVGPAANMWCIQTPMPTSPVSMVASATYT